MPKKKLASIIVLVILILGGGYMLRAKNVTGKQAKSIQVATAKRSDFIKTVNSAGKIKATRQVDLKFQTSGKLTWVGVKEGDHVSANQAIAELDPREVQKTLDKALHDYSKERNDFEETWRVTYRGHSPQDALTDTVKRILEKNQWDLDKAVFDVELKHLGIEYATLTTPLSGIVTHIDTPVPGVNITPLTAVFTVVDPTSLVFEVSADETDISALELGKKAVLTLDAYPDATFSGTISYISYAATTSSGGATVFPVHITFDDPKPLRVGLNGDVTIDAVHITDVVTIPVEGVKEEENKKFVYKKIGKTYKKTAVITGLQNNTQVVIIEGVQDGDSVVVKGFTALPK